MNRIKILIFIPVFLLISILFLVSKVSFNFNSSIEGLFLLQGEKGNWYEVTDDLVPEDASRLIWAMPLYPFKKFISRTKCDDNTQPCIDFAWDKSNGRGYIKNTWADGTKLVINLGRFKDSKDRYPSGVFIGGGLPPTDPDYQHLNKEATGMAYFDGRRWYHVWCNSNEGIVSLEPDFFPIYPTDWTFKGSWVRENDGKNLTIESRHHVMVQGEPLELTRVLFYTAGNKYTILTTEITNRGKKPVTFEYHYGDEPWIGYFGSSAGDVGWFENEIIYSERELDTRKHTYFGMYDYGNELAGETHNFTGIANFIEWPKNEKPDIAYVSNNGGGLSSREKSIPLNHMTNRFIGLIYGPLSLRPTASLHFMIAVGMAEKNPATGFPVKPKTELNP